MPYETVIHRFNQSVNQSTNGAHRIGTVRIHRDSARANEAGLVWKINTDDRDSGQGCWPNAHLGGFGRPGTRILMCEIFVASDIDLLRHRPNAGGDTLAHEWGHYAYALPDEYRGSVQSSQVAYWPLASDTPSVPSIMNSSWCATNRSTDADADLKCLEFSTDKTRPFNRPYRAKQHQRAIPIVGRTRLGNSSTGYCSRHT